MWDLLGAYGHSVSIFVVGLVCVFAFGLPAVLAALGLLLVVLLAWRFVRIGD